MSPNIDTKFISVVSPVYKAELILDELVVRLRKVLKELNMSYEIILVEDGSPDHSWEKVEEICEKFKEVKGIKLSRNFGQHYAVTAGLQHAKGDVVIIMDCDLQDDPNSIGMLLNAFQKGNEVVFTKRLKRRHSFLKSLNSAIYNLLFGFFSDRNYDVNAGSMVLMSSRVREIFLQLEDKDRLYLQMLKWIGFKSTYVEVAHHERFSGTSSYSFGKLLKMALQGWTSHSDKLLKLSVYGGFLLSLVTFVLALFIVFQYFLSGFQPGWPSLFVAIMFSTGLILMSIGIAGIYIGKIFEQTKNRPLYIIDRKINID